MKLIFKIIKHTRLALESTEQCRLKVAVIN